MANLMLTGYMKGKKGQEKALSSLLVRLVWMDGGIGVGGMAKEQTLLRARSDRMSWRAMSVHILKGHSWCEYFYNPL